MELSLAQQNNAITAFLGGPSTLRPFFSNLMDEEFHLLPYNNYIMLNLECLNAILSIGIKQVELGLLISICSNLLVNENICLQDNNEPHTTSSIAKLTGHSVQATKKKLNSLKKMDLLNHSFTKYKFGQKKVYRVNPHIIRKGVHMNSILATLFNDITVQSLMRKKQMSTKEVNPKK